MPCHCHRHQPEDTRFGFKDNLVTITEPQRRILHVLYRHGTSTFYELVERSGLTTKDVGHAITNVCDEHLAFRHIDLDPPTLYSLTPRGCEWVGADHPEFYRTMNFTDGYNPGLEPAIDTAERSLRHAQVAVTGAADALEQHDRAGLLESSTLLVICEEALAVARSHLVEALIANGIVRPQPDPSADPETADA